MKNIHEGSVGQAKLSETQSAANSGESHSTSTIGTYQPQTVPANVKGSGRRRLCIRWRFPRPNLGQCVRCLMLLAFTAAIVVAVWIYVREKNFAPLAILLS